MIDHQERIINNAFSHFLYLPQKLGMVSKHESGFSIINSHLQTSMFNIVCDVRIEQFLKDEQNRDTLNNFFKDAHKESSFLGRLIQGPLASYRSGEDCLIEIVQDLKKTFNHTPYAWWMSDQCSPLWLVNVLVELGCEEPSIEKSLAYDLSKFDESILHKTDISVTVVLDEKTLHDFLSVLSCIDAVAIEFYKKLSIDDLNGREKLYVAYSQGEPVTIAILYTENNMSGLYTLVTHPKYRKKGYAKQMIHYLMDIAKKSKSDQLCLIASKTETFYERLGFDPVGIFVCVEGHAK